MSAVLTPPPVARPSTPPPVSVGPPPRLWTRQEFRQLWQLGLFRDRRAMLVRGVIYEERTMNPPHATGLLLATNWLRRLFPTGHDVRSQVPIDLAGANDPIPDVSLVTGSVRDYATVHPTVAQTRLIVEVSDTTAFFDLTTKAELYAEAGVVEYWVLDVVKMELTVLRDPAPLTAGGHAYQSVTVHQPTDSVAPLAAPNSPVLVSELLP